MLFHYYSDYDIRHKEYFAAAQFSNNNTGNSNGNNKIQEWKNQKDNIKIQFTYTPAKPIIDTFTELKFDVQNLTTHQHIKDFVARVVVTNGQRLFKFENISVSDGVFSVKYIFPDDGTHQVITRVDTHNSVNLASFNVFVPHQSPPSILNPWPTAQGNEIDTGILLSKVAAIVFPILAVAGLIYIIKIGRRKSKTNSLV